jgi:hypothetical protein
MHHVLSREQRDSNSQHFCRIFSINNDNKHKRLNTVQGFPNVMGLAKLMLVLVMAENVFIRYLNIISSIFLRFNRSKLYRSYIEEISKLYRRNDLID